MYMYNKKNYWDLKIIVAAIALGALGLVLCSWAEAIAEHGTDYELNTPWQEDQRGHDEAAQESKDEGASSYTDSNGDTTYYQDGNPLA